MSHLHIQERETSRKTRVKESKYLYLFDQCFGNTQSSIKITSSDYYDHVSTKFKYLNSYNYIFNPVLFIMTFEGSYFGSRENTRVSHQNSQTFKEKGVDISLFLGSSILH